MSETGFKKLPGVLSFQRGMIISDGIFRNHYKGDKAPDGAPDTVSVIRHGIRGTQNINNDAGKEVSNIQTTETAKTHNEAIGTTVTFDLRLLALNDTRFACAGEKNTEIQEAIDGFIAKAVQSEGLQEVARRYARNLFNGRWLWRNRLLGQQIMIHVTADDQEAITVDNALNVPLQHFDDYSDAEQSLGKLIADNISGQDHHTFHIEATILFGFQGAVELFPSQNYIENKPKGFARPLYKLGHPAEAHLKEEDLLVFTDTRKMGIAALRDQKISNAIRTIDTWYPDFDEHGQPIPVEPNGANLDAMRFFRRDGKAKKHSAFDLMRRIPQLEADTPDGMFMIASLMRGGVFSEAEKSSRSKKSHAA